MSGGLRFGSLGYEDYEGKERELKGEEEKEEKHMVLFE